MATYKVTATGNYLFFEDRVTGKKYGGTTKEVKVIPFEDDQTIYYIYGTNLPGGSPAMLQAKATGKTTQLYASDGTTEYTPATWETFYTANSGKPSAGDLAQYMDKINLQSKDTNQFTLAAGNKISSWNDGIAAWTQGTDANRPTLTSGVPLFDGSNDVLIRASEISATTFSLYMVFKDTGAITKIFLGAQSASDYFMHTSPSSSYDAIKMAVGGVDKQVWRAGITGNRYSIFSVRRNGNTLTAKLNDRTLFQVSSTFAGQATLISRLMAFTSGFNMAGGVKALCMSSQYLDDATDLTVRNQLWDDYAMTADNAAECVMGFGDSNTVGTGSTSYLIALSTLLGVADANVGISGSFLTPFNASSGVTRYQDALITRPFTDYIVIQYGTNDSITAVSANTIETSLNTVVSGLIAAGYNPAKICLCSQPYQRSNANAALLDAYRTKYVAAAATYGTKYFDLLQDMRDNGGDALLVAADNVHLNNVAQGRWATGVHLALTT